MKKILIPAVTALLAATLVSNAASAMGHFDWKEQGKSDAAEQNTAPTGRSNSVHSVPELSANGLGSVFVIMAGAALIAMGRRPTKKTEPQGVDR